MPLIATRGAASAQGFGEFAQSAAPVYIEDVFSTYLYTGNSTSGGTQTITNNIDLSTKGGLVWIKGRSAASDNILTDTDRGAGASATNNNALSSNLTTAEDLGGSAYDYLSSFSTTGFVVTQGGTTTATRGTNYNAVTYSSWTFRKQAKFFDVVTYTGDGSSDQWINHNLGASPGCIIIKKTSSTGNWCVFHGHGGSLATDQVMFLNLTKAEEAFNSAVSANSTQFSVPNTASTTASTAMALNDNGATYVAYLFAHDAGGFGLTGTDNVISCGWFTTDGSGNATVNLGWEPQWFLRKRSDSTGDWRIADNMRGWTALGVSGDGSGKQQILRPNLSNAEATASTVEGITSTGFGCYGMGAGNETYIYIAIRRGPMKTPTSGTSVFAPVTATNDNNFITAGFPVDWMLEADGAGSALNTVAAQRLTGSTFLKTSSTDAEGSGLYSNIFQSNTGVRPGAFSTGSFILWNFGRAPSFMDVVCYTGTGSATTVTHNLGVTPELIICKSRSSTYDWAVYSAAVGNSYVMYLNTDFASSNFGAGMWNNTSPTSSVFSVGTNNATNGSSITYVAYLFATCAGVSKVGSYTGTGTTKQIDCGFTGGARFVLIKRTDNDGDWYVWDSARGIVAGNDPYLLLNSTAAEVTNTDYVDTYSAGFEISSTAPAAINANGGTFIFLAIA